MINALCFRKTGETVASHMLRSFNRASHLAEIAYMNADRCRNNGDTGSARFYQAEQRRYHSLMCFYRDEYDNEREALIPGTSVRMDYIFPTSSDRAKRNLESWRKLAASLEANNGVYGGCEPPKGLPSIVYQSFDSTNCYYCGKEHNTAIACPEYVEYRRNAK